MVVSDRLMEQARRRGDLDGLAYGRSVARMFTLMTLILLLFEFLFVVTMSYIDNWSLTGSILQKTPAKAFCGADAREVALSAREQKHAHMARACGRVLGN